MYLGKIKTEVEFIEKNGRTLSQRTSFYQNGQVAERGTYVRSPNKWAWDQPIGTRERFFEDGILESRVSYDHNGYLHGESHYFDRRGKLIKILVYSSDKLVEEKLVEDDTSIL